MICFMCVQGYTNSNLSFVLFDFFNYFRTKWHACTNCYCFGVPDCGGGGERWLHGDDNRGNSGQLLGGTIGQPWKGAGRKEIWAILVSLTMSVTGAIAVYGAEELILFACRIRIQRRPVNRNLIHLDKDMIVLDIACKTWLIAKNFKHQHYW